MKRAKDARDAMDRVRKIKGKKILKKAAEDRERMILEKKAAEERKTIGEIRREKERENKIQNKSLRMHKVRCKGPFPLRAWKRAFFVSFIDLRLK